MERFQNCIYKKILNPSVPKLKKWAILNIGAQKRYRLFLASIGKCPIFHENFIFMIGLECAKALDIKGNIKGCALTYSLLP